MNENEYDNEVALKRWDRERDDAYKAWRRNHDFNVISEEAVIQFGIMAMRAPALIAVGSIAALLVFYSANSKHIQLQFTEFNITLILLMAALLLSAGTTSFAYLTQYCYANSEKNEIFTWEHPFLKETRKSKNWNRFGIFFHYLCIIFVLVSYICLIKAGFHFVNLLSFV